MDHTHDYVCIEDLFPQPIGKIYLKIETNVILQDLHSAVIIGFLLHNTPSAEMAFVTLKVTLITRIWWTYYIQYLGFMK